MPFVILFFFRNLPLLKSLIFSVGSSELLAGPSSLHRSCICISSHFPVNSAFSSGCEGRGSLSPRQRNYSFDTCLSSNSAFAFLRRHSSTSPETAPTRSSIPVSSGSSRPDCSRADAHPPELLPRCQRTGDAPEQLTPTRIHDVRLSISPQMTVEEDGRRRTATKARKPLGHRRHGRGGKPVDIRRQGHWIRPSWRSVEIRWRELDSNPRVQRLDAHRPWNQRAG